MAGERYGDAQQMAGVLLQTGGTAERAAVTLAYGRILLAQNDKKDFTEYRKNLRKLKLKGTDAALVEVYDAWAQAITKPTEADAAIKGLEEILGKNKNCDATSEAADVLAQLYIARGDTADAKRVVEAGLKQFSGYQPPKTAYIDQILKNRLKAKLSEAQKLYDAAEKLRNDKKFLEAGRVYSQVQSTYAKDVLAQAATYHMGECLLGLQKPEQAMTLWTQFLKALPAGPWRGQARVAVADLLLDQLDLAGATEQIRQAAAILDSLPPARIHRGLRPHQTYVCGKGSSRFWPVKVNQPSRHRFGGEGSEAACRRERTLAVRRREAASRSGRVRRDRSRRGPCVGPGPYRRADGAREAAALFTSVQAGRIKGTTAIQISFACQGVARALVAKDDLPNAKEAYLASLKANERAAFHDATLRELALLVERQAAGAQTAGVPPLGGGGGNARLKAELQRSQSRPPHCKKPCPTGKSWQPNFHPVHTRPKPSIMPPISNWPATSGSRPPRDLKLLKDFPKSRWAGDAYMALIDIRLERLLDLEWATDLRRRRREVV